MFILDFFFRLPHHSLNLHKPGFSLHNGSDYLKQVAVFIMLKYHSPSQEQVRLFLFVFTLILSFYVGQSAAQIAFGFFHLSHLRIFCQRFSVLVSSGVIFLYCGCLLYFVFARPPCSTVCIVSHFPRGSSSTGL